MDSKLDLQQLKKRLREELESEDRAPSSRPIFRILKSRTKFPSKSNTSNQGSVQNAKARRQWRSMGTIEEELSLRNDCQFLRIKAVHARHSTTNH